MFKIFIILGSINMLLSVALGAFGAHGLRDRLTTDMLAVYQTAVQYHMIHAIGLLIVGVLVNYFSPSAWIHWAGWSLFIGIVIFSGSLYILSTTGIRWLGAITPIGGMAFIIGWLCLCIAAWKHIG